MLQVRVQQLMIAPTMMGFAWLKMIVVILTKGGMRSRPKKICRHRQCSLRICGWAANEAAWAEEPQSSGANTMLTM